MIAASGMVQKITQGLARSRKSGAGISKVSRVIAFSFLTTSSLLLNLMSFMLILTASPILRPNCDWYWKSNLNFSLSMALKNLASSGSVNPLFREPYLGIRLRWKRFLNCCITILRISTRWCFGKVGKVRSNSRFMSANCCLELHQEACWDSALKLQSHPDPLAGLSHEFSSPS